MDNRGSGDGIEKGEFGIKYILHRYYGHRHDVTDIGTIPFYHLIPLRYLIMNVK